MVFIICKIFLTVLADHCRRSLLLLWHVLRGMLFYPLYKVITKAEVEVEIEMVIGDEMYAIITLLHLIYPEDYDV